MTIRNMDKELIDRVWKYYLPKEFKEEVKRHFFKKNAQSPFSIECDVLCKYFGHHNLTSDADGEEMLTVPRKDIIELYQEVQKTISQCKGTELAIQAIGIKNVIWSFFGSKCLPDGNEDNFATKEPKPAEPKFNIKNNKEMNLCEILKGHEGETFYSPCYGYITLKAIKPYCYFSLFFDDNNSEYKFTKYGKISTSNDAECVLFPSKDQRDWNKWIEEHKVPKTLSNLL